MESDPSKWAHEKWIALVVWAVLLIALLVTSAYAVRVTVGGDVFPNLLGVIFQGVYTGQDAYRGGPGLQIVAVVGLVSTVAAVAAIVRGWFRFAQLSSRLIVSYTWLEEQAEESTLFSHLLVMETEGLAAEPEELVSVQGAEGDGGIERIPELDLDRVADTLVSRVIRCLAVAWGLLISFSLVIYVAAFFSL